VSGAGKELNILIADDEPLARRLLASLLADMPAVELVAQCGNGREAIQMTRELAPDLLILDIQMPGLTGFDVVKELQSDILPNVIFCTAYQRYAIDAFDLHAVDYLLKPVDEKRLARAIERARQRLADSAGSQDTKTPLVGAIDEIARNVAGRLRPGTSFDPRDDALVGGRKIAVRNPEGTVLVDIDEIDWVDAAGDYMCLHTKGETLIMRSTLKNLMAKLDPDKFKRIHRSTLVNLDRITRATALSKGEYMLDLDCDQQLKVSRNYRQAIKVFLDQR
jgi:two-component system LytT family response regulator